MPPCRDKEIKDFNEIENMTQEEIAGIVAPKQPKYDDLVQELENMPVFNREQAFSEWQSGKKPLLEALMSNYTKPERQITPEQAKKAKFASALTDSLTSLAELFAHGQGAYVRPRQGRSNQQATNDRLRQMQEKYEQDMLRYGNVMANAEMQDWQQHLRGAMDEQGQRRKNILYRAEQAYKAEQARAKSEADAVKYERDRKDKREDADLKYQRDKDLVRERAKYRGSGGGASKPQLTANEIVQIRAAAEKIPKEWLEKNGFVKEVFKRGINGDEHAGYEWKSGITPDMMLALMQMYDSEVGSQQVDGSHQPSNLPPGEELGFGKIPELKKERSYDPKSSKYEQPQKRKTDWSMFQ